MERAYILKGEIMESIVLKEKTTKEIYSVLKYDGIGFPQISQLYDFLPARYFAIINDNLEVIIFDKLEEKPYTLEPKLSFIMVSSNEDLIITTDDKWVYDNFRIDDPFIELLKYPFGAPSYLIETIKEYSNYKDFREKYSEICKIIKSFKWEEAAAIFKERDYKWAMKNGTRTPSEDEIFAEEVRRLVQIFYEEKAYFAQHSCYEEYASTTGRFTIRTNELDGKLSMHLEFVPLESSSF